MSLIKEIKKVQQSIIKKEHKKEDTSIDEERLNNLKDNLNKYPDYLEYTYLQEDLSRDLKKKDK